DLKYGFDRSNKDASIHLHSRELTFVHPVQKEKLTIVAPLPDDPLWKACS
ncbi:MAG: RNA pseudouridine synthase, partial [Flavobacteriaceae bacterium]|nr:RNA pseudouridine synthase [Flavobacteriaceae bacterium]